MPGLQKKSRYILTVILLILSACGQQPVDGEKTQPTPYVEFLLSPRSVVFQIEIAKTKKQRAQGLMFRRSLPKNVGMLFIYKHSGNRSFWMKNTFIPLDLIFFDEKFNVVGIVENATPHSEENISTSSPSKYILEINGGLAKFHGIELGSTALFHSQ
jgi:uncharacterized membrane protein (UPF0127 family)